MRMLAAVTVVAMAVIAGVTGPSPALAMPSHGIAESRRAGEVMDEASRRHHDHDRHHHHPHFVRGTVIYGSYPYYPYYAPSYVAPSGGYWYYCPSAGAYYPYVTYCLESWVLVPAR